MKKETSDQDTIMTSLEEYEAAVDRHNEMECYFEYDVDVLSKEGINVRLDYTTGKLEIRMRAKRVSDDALNKASAILIDDIGFDSNEVEEAISNLFDSFNTKQLAARLMKAKTKH